MKACNNPKCSCSTGIHEGLTFGSGRLDFDGYWSKPCYICARQFDREKRIIQQKLIKDSKHKKKAKRELRKNHEWVFMPAWPFEN